MTTPAATADVHTRRMVDGSPAWKPQATFALVTMPSSASSSPSRHTPNPSPRSALRSTVRATSDRRGADEALAGDQTGQLLLGQPVGARGPARHDQVARLGTGVPDRDHRLRG